MNEFLFSEKKTGTEEGPETFEICSSLAVPREKPIVDSTTEYRAGARCPGHLLCYTICLEKPFTAKCYSRPGLELDFTIR